MISLEQIARVAQNNASEEGFSMVSINGDKGVVCVLENHIDSKQPYTLHIRTIEAELKLSIEVIPFLYIRRDSSIIRKVGLMNYGLECGRLCINPRNGRLLFRIEHYCNDDDGGPSPELLQRLLHGCVCDIRCIEHVLLFETMLDTGLSAERAEQFVDSVFGDRHISNWIRLRATQRPE